YAVIVLGLWRRHGWIEEELADVRLRPGDVPVLQGDDEALERIGSDRSFLMLVPFHGQGTVWRRAWIAAVIMAGTVVAATLNVPLGIAGLAAAVVRPLGQRPEPYVLTVRMASVTALLTPMAHHGNLVVYGPGGYRFWDLARVGAPLTAAIALTVTLMAPLIWR